MAYEIKVRSSMDETKVKDNNSKINRLIEREEDDLRFVLSSRQGRRLLWRVISECGVFKLSYTGSADTNFNEGQRNMGLKIMTMIDEADKNAVSVMMKESKEDENNV